MTNQPARSSAIGTIAGFALGAIAATLFTLAIVWFFRDPSRVDVSRPTVVQQIQQLQRLETVVFNMEKIVSGSQESKYLPRMLAGDRLLLIVHGEVTAGVDLGALVDSQIRIDDKTVTIALPEPSVFSTRLDNARTRVYARETGLFTSPDPELESEVRREAERQLTQAALDGGILKTASTNARATLTSLLQGLGFDAVRFSEED
ncbi:MAG TPA: DUF4230 domain-containing protein [Vicinamibacterales bacterium]|nr:DUF4230 domain-containing protein [Vicinamibacterales bacterium]